MAIRTDTTNNLLPAKKPPYPPREGYKGAGFSYASDMMAIAVNHDDPDGFLIYMDECGGINCEVLISGSIVNYAATHGAERCVRALFERHETVSGHDLDYWLAVAAKPVYGPNARKLTVERA